MSIIKYNALVVGAWSMNRELVNYMNRCFQRAGITNLHPMHAYTLGLIFTNPNITMTELTRYTSRTKSDVSLTINKLIKQGYLQKIRRLDDRRHYQLLPTDKAIQISKVVMNSIDELNNAINKLISLDKQEDAVAIISQYLDLIKQLGN